jgi:hypothetical protein
MTKETARINCGKYKRQSIKLAPAHVSGTKVTRNTQVTEQVVGSLLVITTTVTKTTVTKVVTQVEAPAQQ